MAKSTADTSYKDIGGRRTKFASIPEPPPSADPEVRKFLTAMKETVEVREGKRGNSLDRSIVVRDLLDPAFTDKYWPDGYSTNNPNVRGEATQEDTTPPGEPGSFEVDGSGSTQNVLTWSNPTDGDLAHIEIRAAHVEAIPVFASDASYPLGQLVRFGIYVYEVIEVDPFGTGATHLTGIAPDDPLYGRLGTDTICWMRLGYPYRTVANADPRAIVHAPAETWTHVLTGDLLGYDWYYWARAVDESGNVSQWVPQGEGKFALAKTSTGITPDPENLSICETGSTTEFNNLDVNLCWSPSTKMGVKDYIVEVLTTATGERRRIVKYIRGVSYTYSYGENLADGGGTPEDALTFKLWAVDMYDQVSENYDEISVTNPPPDGVEVDAAGIMQGVRFEWDPSKASDFSHYMYRLKVESGAWSAWQETSVSIVDRFLTEAENVAYVGEATIYIEVYVVDTWGNNSTTASANADSISFIVKPHNIDDFAIEASKIWVNIPILEADVWYANNPGAGYIKWGAHNLYLNGVKYQISTGYTNKKYVYWLKGDTYYHSSADNPKGGEYPDESGGTTTKPDLLSGGDDGIGYVIAVNINGAYQVAWNAIANQIIGSAYIEDASIINAHIGNLQVNNAKIYGDLDATKIISGDLVSQNWSPSAGSHFGLNDGDFELGGWTAPALQFAHATNTLTLRGVLIQSEAGGDPYPMTIYRGAWNSGTTYYIADMVTYQGSSWICTASCANIHPDIVAPGSNYWDLSAAKGDDGAPGADGAPGDDGAPGADGADGIGATYQGEWKPSTYYYGGSLRRDVVKYLGTLYICQEGHTSASLGSTVSPTGYSSSTWTGAVSQVYDNNGGTYVYTSIAGRTCTVTRAATLAKQLSIYVFRPGESYGNVKVKVYTSSGWITVHDGELYSGSTIELDAVMSITKVEIESNENVLTRLAEIYIRTISATNLPGSSSKWTTFGATFASVATDLILANDATILRALSIGSPDSKIGNIHSAGKSFYADDNDEGFFIGWDSGVAKVNIGGPDKYMKWTGTTLQVGGDIIATGNIQGNAVSQLLYDDDGGVVVSYGSLAFGWVTLCSITMTISDADNIGVHLMATVPVNGATQGSRPYFFQWVDLTPSVGTPTYYLKVTDGGSGTAIAALFKAGTELARVHIPDVGSINKSAEGTKSILTALYLKR